MLKDKRESSHVAQCPILRTDQGPLHLIYSIADLFNQTLFRLLCNKSATLQLMHKYYSTQTYNHVIQLSELEQYKMNTSARFDATASYSNPGSLSRESQVLAIQPRATMYLYKLT